MAAGPCGGLPVFQSTTVAPPSGSTNTASMRPRTTVSPIGISNGTSTAAGVRAAHDDAVNALCNAANSSGSPTSRSAAPGRSPRSNSSSAP
ncbi:Uncharacterised protein [Mycobacterium tuberculosis]|nr:Uncharacterised protein [Mycobacterium tuberculosis]